MLCPGTKAPDFNVTAWCSIEKGKEFKNISNKDYTGQWIVLYTYPKDFTFVCPTEIVEFERRKKDFEARNAVLLGGSTDNEYAHLAWCKEHPDLKKLSHPLLFIPQSMAIGYGLLHPTAEVALRATFLIDPEGTIRYACANELSVGRNVDEIIRVLDGLQTGELVACNWKKGEETLTAKLKKA